MHSGLLSLCQLMSVLSAMSAMSVMLVMSHPSKREVDLSSPFYIKQFQHFKIGVIIQQSNVFDHTFYLLVKN